MVPGWLAGAVPDWGLLKSAVRRQVFVITGKVVGEHKVGPSLFKPLPSTNKPGF